MTQPAVAGDRPPRWYWVLPAAIGALRGLPFLWSYVGQPEAGETLLNLGYAPRDFLAYVAFIRQFADEGGWLAANPFTTLAQEGRFLLPFHLILGWLVRVTGVAPAFWLELVRIPLTFVFFGTVWWFLRPLMADRRERLAAALLIGLAGGLEGWLSPLIAALPPDLNPEFILQSTWHLYGWNTFGALYNPLWITGLTLTLVALRPVLDPSRQTGVRHATTAAATFALIWIHPYSGAVVLATILLNPMVRRLIGPRISWSEEFRRWYWLAPSLGIAYVVMRWQHQDAVFAQAAQNFYGTFALPVFWYPLTLGAVGLLAIRGARQWSRESRAAGIAVLAWVTAVVILHTSPIVNGYHFVMHLHLPIAIVGATILIRWWDANRNAHPSRQLALLTLLLALFASPVFTTIESLGDIGRRNAVPADYAVLTTDLAQLPVGHVLAPPALGNIIPAYTRHRVWVGHWFLTPDFGAKNREYEAMTRRPTRLLAEFVVREGIRYVVVENNRAPGVESVLQAQITARRIVGQHTLLTLD